MKGFVTGVGPDGRSRVERQVELDTGAIFDLWATPAGTPTFGLDLDAPDLLEIGVRPGGVRWVVVGFGPGQEAPMHWTPTIDFDTVLRGSIELLLEGGPVLLEAGDCVVVTGVRHGWRAGPDGCLYTAAVVGVTG